MFSLHLTSQIIATTCLRETPYRRVVMLRSPTPHAREWTHALRCVSRLWVSESGHSSADALVWLDQQNILWGLFLSFSIHLLTASSTRSQVSQPAGELWSSALLSASICLKNVIWIFLLLSDENRSSSRNSVACDLHSAGLTHPQPAEQTPGWISNLGDSQWDYSSRLVWSVRRI